MKNLVVIVLISVVLTFASFIKPQSTPDIIQIEFADISIKCEQYKQKNYIINTNEEYQEILSARSPHPVCGTYSLPIINFSKYTLLGMHVGSGGCNVIEGEHFITKNVKTDSIEFNMNIAKQGSCKMLFIFTAWCLIPKVEDTSKINFKVNSTYKE